jgi:hypothetical protein
VMTEKKCMAPAPNFAAGIAAGRPFRARSGVAHIWAQPDARPGRERIVRAGCTTPVRTGH